MQIAKNKKKRLQKDKNTLNRDTKIIYKTNLFYFYEKKPEMKNISTSVCGCVKNIFFK